VHEIHRPADVAANGKLQRVFVSLRYSFTYFYAMFQTHFQIHLANTLAVPQNALQSDAFKELVLTDSVIDLQAHKFVERIDSRLIIFLNAQ
jgi:hypothetical protein